MRYLRDGKLPALPLACALFLCGCAANPAPPTCPAGTGAPMRVYELYFGRAIDGRGDITDAEWADFRDEVIIRNLPNGFTVLDGEGAWRNPQTKTTIGEYTKILVTALPDNAASAAAVGRVRDAYDKTFHQITVGMTSHLSCGSFN